MDYFDSLEVTKLKKMISAKEKYLSTIPEDKTFSRQMTQNEIMFLKNDILPIVLKNTEIKHLDFVKYAVSKFEKALEYKCNGLLIYYPIDENYTDSPVVGIANVRQNYKPRTFGAIQIFIDNMDGNGTKVIPVNLQV